MVEGDDIFMNENGGVEDRKNNDVDEELASLLKKQEARVKVVGCGGGGGNCVSRMKEIGIKGCEILALNTDAQDLLYTNVDTKILIGRELTHGLGAGSNPKIGEQAAKESEQELRKKIGDSDLVFITCGLGGGCLRGSSLVHTTKGPVKIKSVKKGDVVHTFYKNKLVKRDVLASMKTGVKKVLELKTRNRAIYASFDHPFLRVKPLNKLSNERFSKFDLEWVKLEDLKKEDLIVVLRELGDEGVSINVDGFDIGENFCRLFGFMLGDGWISRSKESWKIHFSPGVDPELNERYIRLFKKVLGLNMKKAKSSNWYYANSKKVYELLDKLGLNKRANVKEIPDWAFKLSKECKKELIIGLADSDGSYSTQIGGTGLPKKEIKFEMSSEELVKQLKVLCDSIGLRTSNVSSRTRRIKAPNSKVAKDFTAWALRIYKTHELTGKLAHEKSRKGLNFLYKFRSRKPPELFDNFGFNRVSSVKEIGDEEVYDLTVDKSHNFIADGFVVHNTGTGAAPVIAEIAKKQGALTIGVVTLPFTVEGQKRIENSQYGLERMASICDTLIVISNDKLIELAPKLPIHTAFKVADEILTNAVKGITELITKSGLVNLDFADVKAVMANGGVSLIGIGEADGEGRAEKAVQSAINNPLLEVDITNATGALVNITGGNDMSLDEYKKIMEMIGKKIAPEAKLISGAQLSADMDNSIKVLLIVTGVKSSQIMGSSVELSKGQQAQLEEELGIDFLGE